MDNTTLEFLIRTRTDLGGITSTGNALSRLDSQASTLFKNLSVGFAGGMGFAAMGIFQQLPALMNQTIERGVKFNEALEDARTGIAGVMMQFDSQGRIASFNQALAESDTVVEKLRVAAAASPATFKQLLDAFQMTSGAASAANVSYDNQVALVVRLSQTLKALGIPSVQMAQEMRSLLTGEINAGSNAAKMLGITSEMVKGAAAEGQLFEFLMEKTAALGAAGDAAAENYSTAMGNIQDALDNAAGEATRDFFAGQRQGMLELGEAIKSEEFKNGLRDLISLGLELQKTVMGAGVWLAQHAEIVTGVAKAVGLLSASYAAVKIGSWLASIAQSAMAVTRSTAALQAETAALGANTAAQAANNTARSGVSQSAAASISRRATPGSFNAPYSREAYDSARRMGMPADKALDAARRALWEASQVAEKSVSVWGRLADGLGRALGGARALINTPLGGILAGESAIYGVGKLYGASRDMYAGFGVGGKSSGGDLAKADSQFAQYQSAIEGFGVRRAAVSSQEEKDALLADIVAYQQRVQGTIKEAGFFEEGRTAQNEVASDAAQALSQLAQAVAAINAASASTEKFWENVAQGQAARTEFDAIRGSMAEGRRRDAALSEAKEAGNTAPIDAAIKDQEAALRSLRDNWTGTQNDEETNALKNLEAGLATLQKMRAEAEAIAASRAKETEILDRHIAIGQLLEAGHDREATLAQVRLETEERYGSLLKGNAADKARFEELQRQALASAEAELSKKREALELETQLNEAKAAGNSKEVERLQWLREFNALKESGATDDEAARAVNAKMGADESSALGKNRDIARPDVFGRPSAPLQQSPLGPSALDAPVDITRPAKPRGLASELAPRGSAGFGTEGSAGSGTSGQSTALNSIASNTEAAAKAADEAAKKVEAAGLAKSIAGLATSIKGEFSKLQRQIDDIRKNL